MPAKQYVTRKFLALVHPRNINLNNLTCARKHLHKRQVRDYSPWGKRRSKRRIQEGRREIPFPTTPPTPPPSPGRQGQPRETPSPWESVKGRPTSQGTPDSARPGSRCTLRPWHPPVPAPADAWGGSSTARPQLCLAPPAPAASRSSWGTRLPATPRTLPATHLSACQLPWPQLRQAPGPWAPASPGSRFASVWAGSHGLGGLPQAPSQPLQTPLPGSPSAEARLPAGRGSRADHCGPRTQAFNSPEHLLLVRLLTRSAPDQLSLARPWRRGWLSQPQASTGSKLRPHVQAKAEGPGDRRTPTGPGSGLACAKLAAAAPGSPVKLLQSRVPT